MSEPLKRYMAVIQEPLQQSYHVHLEQMVKLDDVRAVVKELSEMLVEINLDNYNEEDVAVLNQASVAVILKLKALVGEEGQR